MHKVTVGNELSSDIRLDIVLPKGSSYPEELYRKLEEWEAVITDTQIRKEDEDHTRYTLTLKLNKDVTKDMLHNLITQNEEVLSVKMSRDT